MCAPLISLHPASPATRWGSSAADGFWKPPDRTWYTPAQARVWPDAVCNAGAAQPAPCAAGGGALCAGAARRRGRRTPQISAGECRRGMLCRQHQAVSRLQPLDLPCRPLTRSAGPDPPASCQLIAPRPLQQICCQSSTLSTPQSKPQDGLTPALCRQPSGLAGLQPPSREGVQHSLEDVMAMLSGERAAEQQAAAGAAPAPAGTADPAQPPQVRPGGAEYMASLMDRIRRDLLTRAAEPETEPAQVGRSASCMPGLTGPVGIAPGCALAMAGTTHLAWVELPVVDCPGP